MKKAAEMGKVRYIEFNGAAHDVEAADGQSLMEAATTNMVPGIMADCGGACACATCHVYVDDAWVERAGLPSEMEAGMLEVVLDRGAGSRLACQLRMSDALDGIVLRLPESQV